MIDYHMHTHLSDGADTHEEHVEKAIQAGIKEIGFSDHLCLKPVFWALKPENHTLLIHKIKTLQENYNEQISIKFGLEVDYFSGRETEIKELIKKFPVDYVIGSVHFLGDWNYDSDKSLYGKWSNDHIYRWYFETLKQAARSGLFDIIGHADLIKKFKIYPESDHTELMKECVEVIKANDLAIELNTSGPDRPCGEFFPARNFLELCCAANVPVTLGSDSHKHSQVGRYFKEGIKLLKEIGFTEIATFTKRNREMVSIESFDKLWLLP